MKRKETSTQTKQLCTSIMELKGICITILNVKSRLIVIKYCIKVRPNHNMANFKPCLDDFFFLHLLTATHFSVMVSEPFCDSCMGSLGPCYVTLILNLRERPQECVNVKTNAPVLTTIRFPTPPSFGSGSKVQRWDGTLIRPQEVGHTENEPKNLRKKTMSTWANKGTGYELSLERPDDSVRTGGMD